MSDEKSVSSEYHSKLLDILKAWLPVLTVCGSALWALITYEDNQRAAERLRIESAQEAEKQRSFEADKERDVRRIELQKPFLDQQFGVYTTFNRIVGEILHAEIGSPDWDTAVNNYKKYSLGEMSLVEDEDVHKSKEQFAYTLERYITRAQELKMVAICRDPSAGGPCAYIRNEMKAVYLILLGDATALATALRKSIERSWSGNLGKSQQLP